MEGRIASLSSKLCYSGFGALKEAKDVTRTLLDIHIHAVMAGIYQIGSLVQSELEQALQAVQDGDLALCDLIIASDTRIDALRSEVELLSVNAFMLQPSLAEHDLRFLSSVLLIVIALERIGDNAAGIAKLLIRMAPVQTKVPLVGLIPDVEPTEEPRPPMPEITEASIILGILDLGQEVHRVLQATIQALNTQDAQAARSIWREDDIIDVRYHMVRHEMMTMMKAVHAIPAIVRDAFIMQRMTYWLWIAHNLERIGDHCANICERTVFFLEGDTSIKPVQDS
jgi:phosphate transport system protein